jgi:hypothetical protein
MIAAATVDAMMAPARTISMNARLARIFAKAIRTSGQTR